MTIILQPTEIKIGKKITFPKAIEIVWYNLCRTIETIEIRNRWKYFLTNNLL